MKKTLRGMIRNADKVIIWNYSSYCYKTCANGGDYAFGEKYTRDGNKWICEYLTTCDSFEYCSKIGSFQECENCPWWYSHGNECMIDYDKFTDDELLDIIERSIIAGKEIEIRKNRKILWCARARIRCKGCGECYEEVER